MIDDVKAVLKIHLPKIEEVIERELRDKLQEVGKISSHLIPVVTAMQELAQGGKRLRGLLTILGYQLSGGEESDEIYKAAAVMELFHLGLLIHDDIMDRDDLRRGVKTIQARYQNRHLGESLAICGGDFTFGWGMEQVSSLNLHQPNVIQAMQVWGQYFSRVGYGQVLDVIGENRGETSAQEVLQVLQLKSGEYSCVLPLQFGAALAGANNEQMEWLKAYGMELGWVFQLRDDWLSEWGDSSKTGKPVGNDRREGRKSYATLYGKEATEKAIKDHLSKGKELAKGNKILEGLLEWMATRNN